ncbi:uncharacterized protein CcaverHIS019_0101090 [Cutaneotrichosporon cavernicola]|uniref:Spindle pole body component n=1 Tax=Cutaneotrichosporon cavernicola TaxID=279322 RepID=A0AA48IAT8_9TREE|nr:uncharacterized protein CcaverHIS019_0101090 [Cutaneotrichosporon cavernicola]BEI87391.1 hypothetical protein CcaverHIS019_0101090 [Cutaneotrichosporon cavernicola]
MSKSAGSMQDLARQLVSSLNPESTPDTLDATARRVAAQVRTHAGASMRKEWHEVRGTLKGLACTARVRVEDDVASAYDKLVLKLEEHRRRGGTRWDEDLPLQASNIPQHVHLLLELAQPTNATARTFAEAFLVRPPHAAAKSDMRLYREIMAAPFEGEHWGPSYEAEAEWSSESESSATPSEDEIVTPAAKGRSGAQAAREAEAARRADEHARLLLAKLQVRELDAAAYWKTGGDPLSSSEGARGWRALSSLPTLASPALPRHDRAISAAQLQREILFALSGRPGILLAFDADTCSIVPGHPEVAAFSPAILKGILSTFAAHATQGARLRKFVTETLAPGAHSETVEAFAAACQGVLRDVTRWVAEREAAFLGTFETSVSTPLVLEREYARFGEVLDALCRLIPLAAHPVALLDALYEATTSPVAWGLRATLTDVFVQAATPIWHMTGDWLVQGMPVPESLSSPEADLALQEDDTERALPPEFFIQRDRDAAWIDEDFWEAGFIVGPERWPAWLAAVRAEVLEGGKARGLLHSLPSVHESETWLPLTELVSPTEDIAEALCGFVAPICRRSQVLLADTLERECGLQAHLAAIDGLSLMRAFDVVDTWADWLFGQMAAHKPWADFHLLTHAMRDAIESTGASLNPAAVRVRTTRRRAGLADIRVDYLVPFPLSQMFTGTSLDLRSDVFGFLLRVLRARKLLLRARSVAEMQAGGRMDVLIPLRRIRHAANWALNTLWIWANAAIDILARRHAASMAGASFQTLTDAAMVHVSGILDAAEALYAVASSTLGVSLPTRRYESDTESESEMSDRFEVSSDTVQEDKLDTIGTALGVHVHGLRDVVEGLEGREGDAAAREMWGMLVFALQDWKDVL